MKQNPPFPIVKTRGTPDDRGEQYGSQCRPMIDRVIEFYRWIFEIKSKLSWDQSLEKAAEFVPFLNDYDGEIMEEIAGIARGAHRSLEEILALNVRTELLFLLAAKTDTAAASCTAVAAVPPSAAHTLLAQNWDWYPQVRECCVIFPERGIISHANHCKVSNPDITDLIPAIWPDSIMRDYRAGKLLHQCTVPIDASSMQQVLQDHFDKPSSICTHTSDDSPPHEQAQTNVSLIMDLTEKRFLVAKGPPCEHEYVDLSE